MRCRSGQFYRRQCMENNGKWLKTLLVALPVVVGTGGFIGGAVWSAASTETRVEFTQQNHEQRIQRIEHLEGVIAARLSAIQLSLRGVKDAIGTLSQRLQKRGE